MSAVLDAWVITDPRASAVTAAEERALRLLSELLQRGGCQPDMPSIATAEDGRPDPQFSRVQSAVASLALQALACPPSQPPRATP